jgi:E3 ubiquitin-protein ligase ZSWIM2
MKIWCDHQKKANKTAIATTSNDNNDLKCPLCRETFSTIQLLEEEFRNNDSSLSESRNLDVHYGFNCSSCHLSPIKGKCYKCTQCNEFYLCYSCFQVSDYHRHHNFVYRERINSKFKKIEREDQQRTVNLLISNLLTPPTTAPTTTTTTTIDETSNLDNGEDIKIPEKVIKSWPSERITNESSSLLKPGIQCRVCLRSFKLNETIRKLPLCNHKFHIDCIDDWLIYNQSTCPIDGKIPWQPNKKPKEK